MAEFKYFNMNNKLSNYANIFIIFALSIVFLVVAKSLLIPFVLAILVWYVIISLSKLYSLINKMPQALAMTLAILTCICLMILVYQLINNSISDVVKAAPSYESKVLALLRSFEDSTGISLIDFWRDFDFVGIIRSFGQIIATFASNLGLIIIYVIFLLLEYKGFNKKLEHFLDSKSDFNSAQKTFKHIGASVNTYLKIKFLMSLLTAVLSFIVLRIFAVDFAIFWAFLFFLLNFIPTVGSMVALAMPIILAMIQFQSVYTVLILFVCLFAVQVLASNIIEPRLMGNSLNLSPLVILLSLAIWGSIWGVIGMILCVPLIVIINIVLANFEQTKPIAILLSANGMIDTKK